MVRYATCASLAAVCLFAGATLNNAAADPVADFYRGKQITAIVPFGSGGSYGLFTQMAARHMSKHIPGNPVIVPQYMPGAGGNKSTSYVYNVAARDGSYMAMVPDGLVISSVLRPKKIKYKPAEFTWVGSMERFPSVLMVRGDSGFMASSSEIGRSFVVPPKVPGDRIRALRTAFDRMVRDPVFLAEVKKRRLIIDPAPGAQIQKAVNRAAAIDPKIAKLMRTAIFGAK